MSLRTKQRIDRIDEGFGIGHGALRQFRPDEDHITGQAWNVDGGTVLH